MHPPPPSSFQSLAADTTFTFTATPHPVISDLKHPKDHVNTQTLVLTLMKKQGRTGSERSSVPPLRFSEPPSPHVNTPTEVLSPMKKQARSGSERPIDPPLHFNDLSLEPPSPQVNVPTPMLSPTKKRARTIFEQPIVSPLRFNASSLAGNDPIPTQGLDGPDLDMPALRHYESDSGDEDDDMYEGDNDKPSGPSQTIFIPSAHTSNPMKQTKLGSFWKAETKEERAERRQ